MRVLRVTLVMALSAFVATHAATPCLQFEPAVTSIVGTLTRKTFPGPPNYESIKDGDRPETYWYVIPATALCVAGTPGDAVNGKDLADITIVQLTLLHDEYTTHARLLGKNVNVTGTVSAAITGHHHAPVVLEVATLELARPKPTVPPYWFR
jgi:Domain of unknown function (DUF4431)